MYAFNFFQGLHGRRLGRNQYPKVKSKRKRRVGIQNNNLSYTYLPYTSHFPTSPFPTLEGMQNIAPPPPPNMAKGGGRKGPLSRSAGKGAGKNDDALPTNTFPPFSFSFFGPAKKGVSIVAALPRVGSSTLVGEGKWMVLCSSERPISFFYARPVWRIACTRWVHACDTHRPGNGGHIIAIVFTLLPPLAHSTQRR